ncbi:hypothetical protein [Joostella sp. CR20]|uniref:hypothetical protein n=1 Tax=Joostella sp. CR20 TaxID=2804312 RepID=UPI00313CD649
MKREIREKYYRLEEKTKFLLDLSEKVGRTYNTLRNHWFGAGMQIPDEFLSDVDRELTKRLKNQHEPVS